MATKKSLVAAFPKHAAAAASGPPGEADEVGSGDADPTGSPEAVGSGDAVGTDDSRLLAEAVTLGPDELVGSAGVLDGDATDAPQPTATSAMTTANVDDRNTERGAPDTHARGWFTR